METAPPSPSTFPTRRSAGRWSALRRWARRSGPHLLIVLAGLAVYSNSFDGPFILDDVASIVENPTIRHLWPIGKVLAPHAASRTVDSRPLENLTLAVNYAAGRTRVGGYHLTNLIIHLLVGLTLLAVVRRTLRLPDMPVALSRGATPLALAAALLWTVHPLTTAAVTYVVQRGESMMALFYLLSLYCTLRGAGSTRPVGWYVAAVAACALGAASKEVIVTAPVVVLLYDVIFLSGSVRSALKKRLGLYVGLACTWGLVGLLVVISPALAQTVGTKAGMSVWDYACTQFVFVARYLYLAIWPGALVFDYGPAVFDEPWVIVPCALLVLGLLGAAGLALWRRRRIGFLAGSFFLILAPTSSIVPITTQTGAEHRMYLPLAVMVTLIVVAGYLGWERLLPRLVTTRAGRRRLGWAVPAVLLAVGALALGTRTYVRNSDYRTRISIWQDTVAQWPWNPRGHVNLAAALLEAGDVRGALEEAEQAVQVDPSYPQARAGRAAARVQHGNACRDSRQFEEALKDYNQALDDCNQALSADPALPEAYRARGEAYRHRGILLRTKAGLILQPPPAGAARLSPAARQSAAAPLYDEACRDFTAALNDHGALIRLKPDDPSAYNYRGAAFLERAGALREAMAYGFRYPGQRGRIDADFSLAFGDFDAAIQMDDAYPKAYYNRGNAHDEFAGYLRWLDRPAEALEHCHQAVADYTRAIELDPGYAKAYQCRAMVYEMLGLRDLADRDRAQAAKLKAR
jgi:tetratricopeptide (TPR) repeat protein